MAEPLLVVDVQRGFVNQYTQHVPARIKRLIEMGEYSPILFTVFVNTPDSPYQRLLDCQSAHGGAEYERLVSSGKLVLQLHKWDVEHHHGPIGDPKHKP